MSRTTWVSPPSFSKLKRTSSAASTTPRRFASPHISTGEALRVEDWYAAKSASVITPNAAPSRLVSSTVFSRSFCASATTKSAPSSSPQRFTALLVSNGSPPRSRLANALSAKSFPVFFLIDLTSAMDSSAFWSLSASGRQSSFSASRRRPSCSSDLATSTTSKLLTKRWVILASNDFARSYRADNLPLSTVVSTPASVACGESFATRRSTSSATVSTNWKASSASFAPTPDRSSFTEECSPSRPSLAVKAAAASGLWSSPANRSALVCGNSRAPSPEGNPGVF
mmetsp:Transcript_4329/g.19699  ORF Transcript_4329/g.19699 Transcript_4329/m.19699 type:complete len:284 (+) Transcript_4329:1821-2672(+)